MPYPGGITSPLPRFLNHLGKKMQIRDATISDIPRLVDLWLTASQDDRDYEIIYPWRPSVPDDFRRLMTAEITDKFLQEERKVVAWACWTRIGTSAAAKTIRAQNDSVLKVLERALLHTEEMFRYPFIRMFSFPPVLRDEGHLARRFKLLYSRFREQFWVGELSEHWFMEKLCVDPSFRRQGIATVLLKWGQDRAREEHVVIFLMSSEAGMAFYLKAGFVQAATCVLAEPEDTMPILLWRPESAW